MDTKSKTRSWWLPFVLFGFILLCTTPAHAMNVTLAWDSNTESDLAGYKVYYGTSSGGPYNGTGASGGSSPIVIPLSSLANRSLPEYSVNNLPNATSYFVLTAYDSEGLESGYSNQVVVTPPVAQYVLTASVTGGNGTISPTTGSYASGTTVTLTAVPSSGYRVLAWTGTANDTLKTNTNTVVMSANKTVTVSFELTPIIPTATTQPASLTASAGATATFTIVASGTAPLTYQWQSRASSTGTWGSIAGATLASYTTPVLVATDTGKQFRCNVTNSAGTANSNAATLTVSSIPGKVINLRLGTVTP